MPRRMDGGVRPGIDGSTVGWQLCLFGEPIAPPRGTRAEAQRDALEQGHASRCELTGRVYVTVPASLEMVFLQDR